MKTKFGSWLRKMLDQKRLSQADLAHRVGVTPAHISRLIAGDRNSTTEMIEKIAHALNVPPETVFSLAIDLASKSQHNETAKKAEAIINNFSYEETRKKAMVIALLKRLTR